MNKLLKPILAAGLIGFGFLSTQAHATYATYGSSGCSNPCGGSISVKPAKYTKYVTTTIITSTVVSRPRMTHTVSRGGGAYCPPPRRYYRAESGQPPRDGRRYVREPSFIW